MQKLGLTQGQQVLKQINLTYSQVVINAQMTEDKNGKLITTKNNVSNTLSLLKK